MKILCPSSLILFFLFTGDAFAEVMDAGAGGFTTVNKVTIDASREDVWSAAIEGIGVWWNADHTISGDANRLSITPVPQGCFCEDFGAGAGVVHLMVTMVNPGVVIRLTGGLGPLGLMGVNGNMTWEFEDLEGGTSVNFSYAVGGYHPQGLDTMAEPVDYVLGEALARLKAHIEAGEPEDDELG